MSAIFETSALVDPTDPIEGTLKSKYDLFNRAWKIPQEQKSHALLTTLRATMAQQSSTVLELHQAFVYRLLATEAEDDDRMTEFEAIHALVDDGWIAFTNHLKYFSFTGYRLLKPYVRLNLIWILEQLMSLDAVGAEGIMIGLLRHQDPSAIALVKKASVIDGWLSRHHQVIVPYAILAMLASRDAPGAELLFYSFSSSALELGKDFLIWLQLAGQLPSTKSIWKCLLDKNAVKLDKVLLGKPTAKRYANALLPPELESWLCFLQENVPMVERAQYMTWIRDRYGSTYFYNDCPFSDPVLPSQQRAAGSRYRSKMGDTAGHAFIRTIGRFDARHFIRLDVF